MFHESSNYRIRVHVFQFFFLLPAGGSRLTPTADPQILPGWPIPLRFCFTQRVGPLTLLFLALRIHRNHSTDRCRLSSFQFQISDFQCPILPFDPHFRPLAAKHLTSSLRCAMLSPSLPPCRRAAHFPLSNARSLPSFSYLLSLMESYRLPTPTL